MQQWWQNPHRMPTSAEAFYARTFALLALLVLGLLVYQILLPLFAPLAWALFIAFLIHPVHRWLARRMRGRSDLSAALLTIATLLLLAGPLTALGAAFAAQAAHLLQFAQQIAADHKPSQLSDLASYPVLGPLLEWLQVTFDVSLEQIQGWAIQAARTALGFIASLGREVFFGALGAVVGFILMMFILFFTIRDWQEMIGTLHQLIPMPVEPKKRLFDHLAAVTRAIVYGTGVTSLIQGALVGIGFALVGLPSPVVFGALAAFLAVVPLAGTPLVWVPAVVYLALQDRWGAALFLLIWGTVVATLDNVLRPILVSGRAEVGTLTVFIGVLGGVLAFGSIGVIAGPLVLALVVALIRFTLEMREQ